MKAMFAKGGKSARVARKWVEKYGTPGKKKRKLTDYGKKD